VSAISKHDKEPIRTIDHYVHHVSTVDANYGKHVKLFVREKVRRDFQVDVMSTATMTSRDPAVGRDACRLCS